MKLFLDTEFVEGFRKPIFDKRRHFIDLISIGIVDDSGREFYAVCKDFDLDYAWNDSWLKENVLKPLHSEMCSKESTFGKTYFYDLFEPFTKRSMRNLLKWQGKDKVQIANEVRHFVYTPALVDGDGLSGVDSDIEWWIKRNTIEFYGYYADYDWVVFCALFGRMIDLPAGFPMYCKDIKQILDSKGLTKEWKQVYCPDPVGEHNALVDARWNKKLFEMQASC